MNWVFISLLPAFFWSCSNILDEYIAKKNPSLNGITFILLAVAVSTFPGLLLLAYKPDALSIGIENIFIFGLLGVFFALCFWPYVIAIKEDGAGLIVPLYQTLPIFIFLLAWLFLGETITFAQLLISVVVVMIASASMIDEVSGFRLKSFLLMMVSCLMLGMYVVLTRYFVENFHWLDITIWNYIGAGIPALIFIASHRATQTTVKNIFKESRLLIVFLFFLQAVLDVVANAFWILALSLAPAAGLVQTVNSVQPFYVLGFSALAFYFMPHLFQKPPKGKYLAWRLFCFLIIVIGIYYLNILTPN